MSYFTLLYFASASTYTKKDSEEFQAPLSLLKLFDVLEERYPGIMDKVLCHCAVTINLNYVDVDVGMHVETIGSGERKVRQAEPNPRDVVVIREGDEVALIPPVSSG